VITSKLILPGLIGMKMHHNQYETKSDTKRITRWVSTGDCHVGNKRDIPELEILFYCCSTTNICDIMLWLIYL